MKRYQLEYAQQPEQVLSLLDLPAEQNAILKMGTARIQKGDWVPKQGHSSHEQHEVSVILSGKLEIESGGQPGLIQTGDVALIPAGEPHRAQALEDTELIWFWFGSTSIS
jgi:quercetin dioxygenase-like cupin family protein